MMDRDNSNETVFQTDALQTHFLNSNLPLADTKTISCLRHRLGNLKNGKFHGANSRSLNINFSSAIMHVSPTLLRIPGNFTNRPWISMIPERVDKFGGKVCRQEHVTHASFKI
jgi:hypothetical protein